MRFSSRFTNFSVCAIKKCLISIRHYFSVLLMTGSSLRRIPNAKFTFQSVPFISGGISCFCTVNKVGGQ